MRIENRADIVVSWFCFNQKDAVKLIALASGDLKAGDSYDYTPPKNANEKYFVRFTYKGGGTELGGSIIGRTNQKITITGTNDSYEVAVSKL